MSTSAVFAAVATALTVQELDRLKAIDCLPTPELLQERLRARDDEFNILVGAVLAYLRVKEVKP